MLKSFESIIKSKIEKLLNFFAPHKKVMLLCEVIKDIEQPPQVNYDTPAYLRGYGKVDESKIFIK